MLVAAISVARKVGIISAVESSKKSKSDIASLA